jgi:hypothetical protein
MITYLLAISNIGFEILVFGIIGIAAWFLLLRAAIRADTIRNRLTEISNHQKATTWFLIKLCEKQGVSQPEIEQIKKTFNIK